MGTTEFATRAGKSDKCYAHMVPIQRSKLKPSVA